MSNDHADPHGIERPEVLGERQTGKAETVTPEGDNLSKVQAKVAKATAKRAKAPTGGVHVAYDGDDTPRQVFSSEIAALRYASEHGYKVRKVGYGADL